MANEEKNNGKNGNGSNGNGNSGNEKFPETSRSTTSKEKQKSSSEGAYPKQKPADAKPNAGESTQTQTIAVSSLASRGDEGPVAAPASESAQGGTTESSSSSMMIRKLSQTPTATSSIATIPSIPGAYAVTPLETATSSSTSAETNGIINNNINDSINDDSNDSSGNDSNNSNTTPVATLAAENIFVATPMDLEAANNAFADKSNKMDTNTNDTGRYKKQGLLAFLIVGVTVAILVVVFWMVRPSPQLPLEDTNTTTTTTTTSSSSSNNGKSIEDLSTLDEVRSQAIDLLAGVVVKDPNAFDPSHEDASADRIAALEWLIRDDSLLEGSPALLEDEDFVRSIRQRYVMALFYYATNGPEWLERYNFLSSYDICKWSTVQSREMESTEALDFGDNNFEIKGIICDDEERVSKIRIWWNNLSGTIPGELSFFSDSLVGLNVGGGSIGGSIPSSLGSLSRLNALVIHDNCLSGKIPEGILESDPLTNLATYGNNDMLENDSFQRFCSTDDPLAFRSNDIFVSVDPSIHCDCCFRCDPFRYVCEQAIPKSSWSNLYYDRRPAYHPQTNYALQFTKKCLDPAQQEYISEHCPCVISNGAVGEEEVFVCSDCSEDGAKPTNPHDDPGAPKV